MTGHTPSQQMTTALRHALIDLKASRTLVQHTMGEPHGLNQTIAMVEAALGAPEEITGAEMDAIEATAIAGKPLQSMDIWQAYAAAQDEIAALKRERAAVIEECAKAAEDQAFAWINGEATTAIGQAYQSACKTIAARLRALQPATPATGGQHG